MNRFIWVFFLLSLFTLVACQDDVGQVPPPKQVCAPGLVQSCPCLGGDDGVQTCAENGASWGACVCPDGEGMSKPKDMDDDDDDMNDDQDMTGDMPCVQPEVDEQKRMAGQMLYAQYCGTCHGDQGQGTTLGPELLEEVAEEPDDEILEVIQEGEDDMPPIAISEEQSRQVIGFLLWLAQQDGQNVIKRCLPESDG